MNRDKILRKVVSRLSFRSPDIEDEMRQDEMDSFEDEKKNDLNEKFKSLAKKYPKLTTENAISYARELQSHYHFEIPKNPKTKKVKESGSDVIYVEISGEPERSWYPVWWDKDVNGLYGEY